MNMITISLVLFLCTAVTADIAIKGVSLKEGLTRAEKKALLDEHNALRSIVAQGKYRSFPSAANMIRLDYSQVREVSAQKQASWCNGPPHGNHERTEGQNFAWSSHGHVVLASAIDGWFHNEAPYYTLGGAINDKNGHFTAMIWATTTEMGCGARQCKGTRLVCNFMPGGNIGGLPAYKRGPPCSQCPSSHPFCLDALCSSVKQCKGKQCKCTLKKAECRNGVYNAQECSCSCKNGFTGPTCSEECKDNRNSGCRPRSRQGHCDPKSLYYLDMMKNCKPSCNVCKPL